MMRDRQGDKKKPGPGYQFGSRDIRIKYTQDTENGPKMEAETIVDPDMDLVPALEPKPASRAIQPPVIQAPTEDQGREIGGEV